MKKTKYVRDNMAMPISYDPNNFAPIHRYVLTRHQIEFLIRIKLEIHGKRFINITEDEDVRFIKNVLNDGYYRKSQIPYLMELREKYKYVMKNEIQK